MDIQSQLDSIKRGTVEIYSLEDLEKKLRENRPLNVKFGIDPTAPDIHLGHTVPLQKLRQFQDMGHNIQLIIGDYTAMIGDPSGRSETRPILTKEKILENLQTYTQQVYKILENDQTQLMFNSSWLENFSGLDMIELASKYTVQQLIQRRDFGKRLKDNRPLSVSELIYPLLVGYDSVHLKTDIEIGGTDQLFNFMASRAIQEAYGQRPEIVITLPILEGLDGTKKMSKSYGNAIGVEESPVNMYGKIMSISDSLMLKYYELLSDISFSEFTKLKEKIHSKTLNPMAAKQQLAREIVEKYHGLESAVNAENHFNEVHRKKSDPTEMPRIEIPYIASDPSLIDIIKRAGYAKSNGEARRLIEQNGVKIDGQTYNKPTVNLDSYSEKFVLQVGKRKFTEVVINK